MNDRIYKKPNTITAKLIYDIIIKTQTKKMSGVKVRVSYVLGTTNLNNSRFQFC